MPKQNKIDAVAEITADLKAADIYYFVDYRGLTFAEATELRKRLRKVDADLKVVKNTLGKIAAANAGVEGLDELLAGPTAIAYVHGDPAKTAKTIQDFIKEKKKSAIRGGKLQRSVLTGAAGGSPGRAPQPRSAHRAVGARHRLAAPRPGERPQRSHPRTGHGPGPGAGQAERRVAEGAIPAGAAQERLTEY